MKELLQNTGVLCLNTHQLWWNNGIFLNFPTSAQDLFGGARDVHSLRTMLGTQWTSE